MFRRGPGRTGQTPHAIPRTQPRIIWKLATDRPVFSSPALDRRGDLYVGSLDGHLYSVTSKGALRWKRMLGGKVFASPAITAGGIAVGADNDRLFMLDLQTGEPRWSMKLGPCPTGPGLGPDTVRCDADSSAAVGPDGTLYFGGDALYAVSARGEQRWRTELPGHAFSSPALEPESGLLFIGTQASVVIAAEMASGNKRWEFKAQGHCDGTPALLDASTLVIGCDDGQLYALSIADGSKRWSFRTRRWRPVRSSPAVGFDRTIYVGANDARLYAIKPDGQAIWSYATGGPIRSSPVVDPTGAVAFGSRDDHLYALDSTGKLLWRVRLGGDVDSSVSVGPDGTLYVGADDGQLYALRSDGS
jgi:outer membrane protein assembly factor BamB